MFLNESFDYKGGGGRGNFFFHLSQENKYYLVGDMCFKLNNQIFTLDIKVKF